MRISDWSSDVCSSDLSVEHDAEPAAFPRQATSDGARLQAARGRRPARHRVPDRRAPAQGPAGLRQHSRQRVLGAGGVGAAGRHLSVIRAEAGSAYMKTTIAPIVLAVLASLPWTAQAAPQETTERRPTAIFSAPEKPVEGRMVLRNSTSDALATQTQGLLAARPDVRWRIIGERARSEEHTSELQSLMRISYAVFCL